MQFKKPLKLQRKDHKHSNNVIKEVIQDANARINLIFTIYGKRKEKKNDITKEN